MTFTATKLQNSKQTDAFIIGDAILADKLKQIKSIDLKSKEPIYVQLPGMVFLDQQEQIDSKLNSYSKYKIRSIKTLKGEINDIASDYETKNIGEYKSYKTLDDLENFQRVMYASASKQFPDYKLSFNQYVLTVSDKMTISEVLLCKLNTSFNEEKKIIYLNLFACKTNKKDVDPALYQIEDTKERLEKEKLELETQIYELERQLDKVETKLEDMLDEEELEDSDSE